jgi:hypothetical protein
VRASALGAQICSPRWLNFFTVNSRPYFLRWQGSRFGFDKRLGSLNFTKPGPRLDGSSPLLSLFPAHKQQTLETQSLRSPTGVWQITANQQFETITAKTAFRFDLQTIFQNKADEYDGTFWGVGPNYLQIIGVF